jgi:hypothetical protein
VAEAEGKRKTPDEHLSLVWCIIGGGEGGRKEKTPDEHL